MNEKEQLAIEALQKAAAHFQTTTLSHMKYKSYRSNYAPDALSASAISKRLGNWSTAIEKAGLDTGRRILPRCTRCGKRYTRQNSEQSYCSSCRMIRQSLNPSSSVQTIHLSSAMIISSLQTAAGSESDSLTLSEYKQFVRKQTTGHYASSSTICSRFGSWKAALQAAGLNPQPRNSKLSQSPYTTEHLLHCLRAAAVQVDGALTTNKFFRLYQRPSVTVIRKRFGGWSEALQAAGITTSTENKQSNI